MSCVKCKSQLKPGAKFCSKCGFPVYKRCSTCGSKLIDGMSFCEHCGKAVANSQGSKTSSFESFVSKRRNHILVALVTLVLVLSVIKGIEYLNSPKRQIIGTWSTNRGLDSQSYKFTKDGKRLYSSFSHYGDDDYYFDGTDLVIEYDDGDTYTYKYSPIANYYDDYWYIDGDTLYLSGKAFYRVDD